LDCASPKRDDTVRDTYGQVLMPVKPNHYVRAKRCSHSSYPVSNLVENQRTSGVRDVHALTASVGHDLRLGSQDLGGLRMRHHKEPNSLKSELTSRAKVLNCDIRLGAVGRNADH
jgi:hypothetical protein